MPDSNVEYNPMSDPEISLEEARMITSMQNGASPTRFGYPPDWDWKRVLAFFKRANLPTKQGTYLIKVRDRKGAIHNVTGWYNPDNGHWLIEGEERGFQRDIHLPGHDEGGRFVAAMQIPDRKMD